jgi:hypothetical protein
MSQVCDPPTTKPRSEGSRDLLLMTQPGLCPPLHPLSPPNHTDTRPNPYLSAPPLLLLPGPVLPALPGLAAG